jgi:hypothetical protein
MLQLIAGLLGAFGRALNLIYQAALVSALQAYGTCVRCYPRLRPETGLTVGLSVF